MSASKSSRKRYRFCFDVYTRSEEEKIAITSRVDAAQKLLTPEGSPPLDNCSLVHALLDAVESHHNGSRKQPTAPSSSGSFLREIGKQQFC
jgi:hypothetical protein